MNWTKILFIILILALLVLGLFFFKPILGYLLLSVVLAYIFDPLVSWLEYRHIPRWLSVLVVYCVIGGLVAWITATYAPRLISEGEQLVATLTKEGKPLRENMLEISVIRSVHDFLQNLDKSIPQLGLTEDFFELIDTLREKLVKLPQVLLRNYQAILGTVAMMITVPVFSFFIMKDKRALRRGLLSVVPNKFYELGLILLKTIDHTVGRYLRAILLEMIAVSIMTSVALTIVGVPYSLLIGIIAGITNVIPYFGPYIGGGVAILTVLIMGRDTGLVIWVALSVFLVQQLDNYIVYPLVVGKTIKMHPLIVLVTVLAGGYFGGVIWMLISVPLVFMMYSLTRALYINLKRFRLI